MPLAFGSILFGGLLVVAGYTGSTLRSVLTGHPDGVHKALTGTGKAAGAHGAAGVSGVSVPAGSGKLGGLLKAAVTQLGVPYKWGGELARVEFDCSGLVQWAASQAGISLPRTAQEQFNATQRLSPGEVQAGDLVFFTNGSEVSHVGIVVRPGLMIDAPHTGSNVRYETFPTQIGSSWGGDTVAGYGRP